MVLPSRETELRSGDTLGRYQLLMPIGAGGMGRVWVARLETAHGFERVVALKTALSEAAADKDFRDYFLDEGRLAAMIDHPNVCRVQDLGEEAGVLYMTMEWVDGPSLHQLLSAAPSRRLEPSLAVHIVAQVCAGLHAAHELEDEHGEQLHVVHRDVSPQNVLLTASGHVKLTDFGVAKARGQLHRTTETGELKGKLSYMAPEQVSSKNIDRRADVFAAGCVLYEAVTGVKPFHAADAMSALYNLLERPLLPPSELRDDLPVELDRVIMKALERSPNDRYQTADELRSALDGWLRQLPKRPTPRDLCTLIEACLGADLESRRALIRERTAVVSAGGKLAVAVAESQPTIVMAEPSVAGVSNTRSRRPPAPVSQRAPWLVAVAALVGAAATAALVMASGRTAQLASASSPASSSASVPSASTPSPAGAPVTLRLNTDAVGATARIDGGQSVALPATLELERRQRPRVVTITAPGRETVVREVSGSQDLELQLRLNPLTVPSTASPAASVAARRVTTVPHVAPSATAPTGGKRPAQPRVLDKTNPFLEGT